MEWSTCSENSIDWHVFAMLTSDSWQTIPGPGFSQTSNSDVQQYPWDIPHSIRHILAILQGCRKIISFGDVVGNIPGTLFDVPIRSLGKTFWGLSQRCRFLGGKSLPQLVYQNSNITLTSILNVPKGIGPDLNPNPES